MTARHLAIALIGGVACATPPHNAILDKYPSGVVGRTSVTYYDVHGRTIAELRADMRRLGPKSNDTSFVGETRSPMRWSWKNEQASGGLSCTVRYVTVSVNAQILLPRWTPPADTAPGVFAEWNRFIAALETHESGHKDIAAKAGREIVERLTGLSGSCSQIGVRANDIARLIMDRAHEEQRKYDADTRHGVTQGTSFGARASAIVDPSAPLMLVVDPRPGTVRAPFALPLDRVWNAMPAAYAASGLRVNAVDSSAHAVGDSLTARGTVSGIALSEIVDCGTPPSGRNADSTIVALFVTSRLFPGTMLLDQQPATVVVNTVQAVAHQSGERPILCRSRGLLERNLVAALRAQLVR